MARNRVSLFAGASFALAAVAGLALVSAQAGGLKLEDPVKVQASARPAAGGTQTVTITLDIKKPWHIYANPVQNEDLLAAQTSISFPKGVKIVEVKYPAGKTVNDKVLGKYNVYEDRVSIPVTVERAAGETGPLEVTVRYQACDEKRCLQPSTVKVKAP